MELKSKPNQKKKQLNNYIKCPFKNTLKKAIWMTVRSATAAAGQRSGGGSAVSGRSGMGMAVCRVCRLRRRSADRLFGRFVFGDLFA